MFADRNAD